MSYSNHTAETTGDPVLIDWRTLCDHLVKADEDECKRLLAIERKRLNRHNFVMRIHSRLNRMRRAREREELSKARRK